MKRIIFIILIITGSLTVPAQDIIKAKKVITHNGLVCFKKKLIPVSGIVVEKFEKNPKQLYTEVNYENGKKEGLYRRWYLSGQIREEINYSDGKKHGRCIKWNQSSDTFENRIYKNGFPIEVTNWSRELENRYSILYHKKSKSQFTGIYLVLKEATLNLEWVPNTNKKKEINYKNGKKDGLYKSWYSNGDIQEEINYSDGKKEGLYRSWYSNGDIQKEINYSDGKKHGRCRKWNVSGDTVENRIYKDDFPLEVNYSEIEWKNGIYYHKNSSTRFSGLLKDHTKKGWLIKEYNFLDGKKSGLCREWYSDGEEGCCFGYWNGPNGIVEIIKEKSNADYEEDEVEIEETRPDRISFALEVFEVKEIRKIKVGQLKYECNYKTGNRVGICRMWHSDGELYKKTSYRDDIIDGTDSTWHEHGVLNCVMNYKNGKLNDEVKLWNFDGDLIRKVFYKDGFIDGLDSLWYQQEVEGLTPKIKYVKNYIKDKLDGEFKEWFINGQLKSKTLYLEGYIEDLYRTWWSNGQLRSEGYSYAGVNEGKHKTWYENGKLESEKNYLDGNLRGVYRQWYENGQLKRSENSSTGQVKEWYENGKLKPKTISLEEATTFMRERCRNINQKLQRTKSVNYEGTILHLFLSVASDGSVCISAISELKLEVLSANCGNLYNKIEEWNNL